MAICPEILGFLLERRFLNGQMFNVLSLKGTIFKVKQTSRCLFVIFVSGPNSGFRIAKC